MDDLKSKFYRTFANLPLGVRDEIIVVIDNQPMTWNVVKVEVDANSDISKEILKKLQELKLLKNEN